MDESDRWALICWVRDNLSERMRLGEERCHSQVNGFQGDPLAHAIEEWLDMGVYLFYALRQQKELATSSPVGPDRTA